jgi:hypothetical protein
MPAHAHRIAASEFPFALPQDTAVYASVRVLEHGMPIVVVVHDTGGDWEFSCGSTDAPEHRHIACLGCVFDADPSLAKIADLPVGWAAWRETRDDAWERGDLAGPGFDDDATDDGW